MRITKKNSTQRNFRNKNRRNTKNYRNKKRFNKSIKYGGMEGLDISLEGLPSNDDTITIHLHSDVGIETIHVERTSNVHNTIRNALELSAIQSVLLVFGGNDVELIDSFDDIGIEENGTISVILNQVVAIFVDDQEYSVDSIVPLTREYLKELTNKPGFFGFGIWRIEEMHVPQEDKNRTLDNIPPRGPQWILHRRGILCGN